MSDGVRRADQAWANRTVGIALLISILLWQLPFGGFVLYPLKLLATWIHELSHAVVMLLTGAGFDHMDIFRDGSGLAHARRGVSEPARAAIAAAGYMGTPLIGAAMMVLCRDDRAARRGLIGLGGLLVATALLVVGGCFGQVAVGLTGLVAILLGRVLPDRWALLAARFVAAQACVNAVVDIRVLYRPSLVVDGQAIGNSDAHAMAKLTFGSAGQNEIFFWATIWLLWALGLFFLAMRTLQRASTKPQ